MEARRLGRSDLLLTPIGFGAFKIGRNEGIKYPSGYALPTEAEAERLLNAVLDAGIRYIDTAPAYGMSEERIGRAIAPRRGEFVLSTKVGEQFERGTSRYDFSEGALRASLEQSLSRLRTPAVDIVFLHVPAGDEAILRETDAVAALLEFRRAGMTRAVGLSAKSIGAARLALQWADALMLEYHPSERTFEPVIAEAAGAGVGVVVKKALASGRLPARDALRFVLSNAGVSSAVVGSLSLDHLRENIAAASG